MYTGDITQLSLEELQKTYADDIQELQTNINTLNTGIEDYKEKENTYQEEIKKLKLVNYDLFTKVGQSYNSVNTNNGNTINNEEMKKASIDDVIKDFNF